MTKALIVVPDPDHPGGVTLREYANLHRVWMDASADGTNSGILCVQPRADDETVFYGPGSWHSWSHGDAPLLPDA